MSTKENNNFINAIPNIFINAWGSTYDSKHLVNGAVLFGSKNGLVLLYGSFKSWVKFPPVSKISVILFLAIFLGALDK